MKNVVTSLKEYRKIADFIERLKEESFLKSLEEKDLEKQLDSFLESAGFDPLSTTVCLLRLLSESQKDRGKVLLISLALSRCYTPQAAEPMIKYLRSPEISDSIRQKILLVLGTHRDSESQKVEEAVRHFANKQNLAKHALESLLAHIGPAGDEKSPVVRNLSRQSPEFYRALIDDLVFQTSEQAMWLLGLLAQSRDEGIAALAIEALGEKKSPLAHEILENMLPPAPCNEKTYQNALERLQKEGIGRVRQKKIFIPYKSYLSEIDGHGNRILQISQRSGRGRLAVVTMMLNEEDGIQDCSCWPEISSFQLESLVKSLESEVGLRQIDYALGLRILEDALWTGLQQRNLLPLSFVSARRIFQEQNLRPKAYEVDLEQIGIRGVRKDLDSLLQNSAKLLSHVPFSEWNVDNKLAYEFVQGRRSLINGHKMRSGTVGQFIKATMDARREIWQRRFLMTADFLYQISPRSNREKIDLCLAIHEAIGKGVPLKSIPFMAELAENTIEQIRKKADSKDAGSPEAAEAE